MSEKTVLNAKDVDQELKGDGGRFHKQLSDVGLYSIGGLCAVSLLQLFDEECHGPFKKKALEKILHDLGQPKQTNESMFAILDGELMDKSDVFVDSLLEETVLKNNRQPLIADFVTLAISEGCYDARMRVLIKHVAWQLRVTWDAVEDIEAELAETLEYNTYVMTEEEAKEKAKKKRNRNVKRYALIGLATVGGGALIGKHYALIGLATVGGGALIGLTGGLAAPLVAAGAGAVIGGAGAAALGSVAGVAIIGSLFGVAGAGLTGYKMKRRVGAVEEFAFEPLTLIGSKYDSQRTVKQLHITIAVTGWLNNKNADFRKPWSALGESREQYSLRWESKYLYQLGEAFDYLLSTGVSMASMEALKYTILSGLITAIAWPAALIGAAGAIDNPWHVCTQRASEAGKQLAEVLLGREQGNRPVTLIGFSLGSRVIFSCLEELAKRKGGEGLIEDVILLGAPVNGDPKHWKPLSRVISGKIVNGYARGDWLLKFLYRTASVTLKVAGLGPVKWDNRRMHNIDLSDIIDGHGDYMANLDIIMKAVGVRTKDEIRSSSPSQSSSQASLAGGASSGEAELKSSAEEGSGKSQCTQSYKENPTETETIGKDKVENGNSANFTEKGEQSSGREITNQTEIHTEINEKSHKLSGGPDIETECSNSKENENCDSNLNITNNETKAGVAIENDTDVVLKGKTKERDPLSAEPTLEDRIKPLTAEPTTDASTKPEENQRDEAKEEKSRESRLNTEKLSYLKNEVQDKVTEAVQSVRTNIKSVKSNVKRTVRGKIRKRRTGKESGVAFSTVSNEVNVADVERLEKHAVRKEMLEESDDEEGCYFTDSNPGSEDEAEENEPV